MLIQVVIKDRHHDELIKPCLPMDKYMWKQKFDWLILDILCMKASLNAIGKEKVCTDFISFS